MKEKEFLKEYELLCQKYKMGLCGCGCCGSPYLNEIDDINYDYELNKIIINHKTIDNYFKEVNDVLNMVEQFMYYYDIDIQDVIEIKHQKINRQLERINKEN